MKKRMKKISIFCLTGMLALGLWACSSSKDGSSEGSSSSDSSGTTKQETSENGVTVNMPEFSTTDMDGNKVTNDIFADYDLTVVNFWERTVIHVSMNYRNWQSVKKNFRIM